MSKDTRHIWEFVETLAGPAVYLAFFGVLYFLTSMACSVDLSRSLVDIAALGLGLVALTLLAAIAVNGWRVRATGGEDAFLGLTTLILAGLSAVAVIWTVLPAATLDIAC